MSSRRAASSWGTAIAAVAVSRLLWLGVFAAVLILDFPHTPLLTGLRDHLVAWDAVSYVAIAAHGYPLQLSYLDAFLPGFPLLVRGVMVIPRDAVTASWLVNAIAETVALWYLARLVLGERDQSSATFSVWLLALAPTALFLIAPFSESAFIAAAAASLYYARAGQSRKAIAAGALACAFRLTGLALIPALAIEQLRRTGWRPRPELALVMLLALPLAIDAAYMQAHIGDALALLHADQLPSFGLQLTPPWTGFAATWNTLVSTTDGETRSIFAREIAFGLLGLLLCFGMWASSRIPRSMALYCTIAWLMTASLPFWRSQPRYILALFPAVLLASDLTVRYPRARPALLGASAVLMCAGTWVYAQTRWLG
ncbi:MAG TPA: mannosyltransferase family protein [Candidatus Dormibacteraeota bacterium]